MNNRFANYIYNNEAIGIVAIASVLRYSNSMSLSKALLILPIVAHKETVNFLKNKKTVVRSIEELVTKKRWFFFSILTFDFMIL